MLVLHVLDDDELDFPFASPARFEGLETADHLTCNPRALREGYLEALDRFLATVRHGCARDNVDYALIRTSMPLDAALTAFLKHRQRERQKQIVVQLAWNADCDASRRRLSRRRSAKSDLTQSVNSTTCHSCFPPC